MPALIRANLFSQQLKLQNRTDISFFGLTVIVTGSNTGLGLAAATKFAEQGASRVILGVRSEEKGNNAKQLIISASKKLNPSCIIEVWRLDMMSYDSIRSFAARAEKELPSLDVAVLNAGITTPTYQQSAYGWESVLQVNLLSTVLLALLLLPKLRASRTARHVPVLEFVGSIGHAGRWPEVQQDIKERAPPNILDSYNCEAALAQGMLGMPQYQRSKLFLQAAVQYLGGHIPLAADGKPEVFVLSICPGAVKTDIGRSAKGVIQTFGVWLFFAFARTPEEGSRTVISGLDVGTPAQGGFYREDAVQK